jgi:opacity protein-like surface antigen
MRRVLLGSLGLLLFAGLANAQVPAGNVFFGYSYYSMDLSSFNQIGWDRANTNGWEASVEGKVIPFLGFVADFDGHYGSQNLIFSCPASLFPCGPSSTDITEHNYLFGPRVSFPSGKFRPFAQVLFGGAHLNGGAIGSDTSFATAVGGGLDYKLIPLLAWRIQGDYVQTRLFHNTQNNVRISTGIVLRF